MSGITRKKIKKNTKNTFHKAHKKRKSSRLPKVKTSPRKTKEDQEILTHFISHQLKGFLTNSRNIFSLMLEGDYGEISPRIKEIAEEGFASSTRAVLFVENILNSANIESGKMHYDMEIFNIEELLREKFKAYRKITDAKGLQLSLEIPEDDYQIEGDAIHLKHALKNLIENTIKYTPQGSIEISLKKTGNKILFSIKDTGIGISKEDMKKMFTAGGRGKKSHKLNIESTGYGLYIVKNIIEGHKGRVWAESEGEGKGSIFFAELPVKQK